MNFLKELINPKSFDNAFLFFPFLTLQNILLNIDMKENVFTIILVTILHWIVNTWYTTRKKLDE